jgi:hypothetical protein
MLTQREILQAWQVTKSSTSYYRLRSEAVVTFEFRGLQLGHPSNYAKVIVAATPAEDFSLDSIAEYIHHRSPAASRNGSCSRSARVPSMNCSRSVGFRIGAANWWCVKSGGTM